MTLDESVRRVITHDGLTVPGDHVLVAVSGGQDSSVLLFILNKLKDVLKIELTVAHVNHQLRGDESQRDEDFVRTLAEQYGLACYVDRPNVVECSHTRGISIQHAGRDLRYRFFHELAHQHHYNRIAIAHNRDDQVETFIIRMIKGTGINGLSSIPIKRGLIIRPFLHAYRHEIETYGKALGITYVEDSSNRKDGYERNFLRHHIVPLMEKLNPQFREKVISLLSDITTVNTVFDKEAHAFLDQHVRFIDKQAHTSVISLQSLESEVRFRVVSKLLTGLIPLFIPLREHVGLVEKSLCSLRPNNSIMLPHGIEVRRAYDEIVFSIAATQKEITDIIPIGLGNYTLNDFGISITISRHASRPEIDKHDRMTAVLDADLLGELAIRSFRDGDRFVPLGMKEPTKLKNFFISRKIPKLIRRTIPLVLSGLDIVWVLGERISESYKVTDHTQNYLTLSARKIS
jgi:tRNA(Ile)-lysidine synthase